MDCSMRYVFSLRVFKQMASPAVKLCFLMISSSLKVMGLYTMSMSRKYVFDVRCLQMHSFKTTTSYLCISCSFPNNWTNITTYPKMRFGCGRLGYSLLCSTLFLLLLFYRMAEHTTVFIHAAPMENKCFHNPHAISMQFHTHEQSLTS